MNQDYHEIFMPLEDVYLLGGPLVFQYFSRKDSIGEKNAIVMSYGITRELEHPSRDFSNIGVGGKEALRKLKTKPYTVNENHTIYHFNDGLDVLVGHYDELTKDNLTQLIGDNTKRFTIVTRDSSEHLKYQSFNFSVQEPKFLLSNKDIVEEGILEGDDELLARLYENDGVLSIEQATELLGRQELYLNQFIRFRTPKGRIFARVTGDLRRNNDLTRIIDIENQRLVLLNEDEYSKKFRVENHVREDVLGIKARDMEQYIAGQYGILNKDAEVVFIAGGAGSGKTLLGYVLGVDQILIYEKEMSKLRGQEINRKSGFYKNMVLLKPNDMMGGRNREVGHLPGNLWEKFEPHLEPFRGAHRESVLDDIIEFKGMFLHSRRANKYGDKRESPKINSEAHLPPKEPIELMTSGFLRGVSFRDTIVIVDEAQNFTPYEMKTILSRGGEGTKFVIMGDPSQYDNPYCSPDLNGFTSAIQFLLPKPQSILIKLPRSYRSQTAEDVLEMPIYSK